MSCMNNRVYRTEEDSISAIEEDPRNIGRVSYTVLNRKMCELAVRKDGCTISLIPELLRIELQLITYHIIVLI